MMKPILINVVLSINVSKEGIAPTYLVNRLRKVSGISSRSTRYLDINLRCPRYTIETEGGKTFYIYC